VNFFVHLIIKIKLDLFFIIVSNFHAKSQNIYHGKLNLPRSYEKIMNFIDKYRMRNLGKELVMFNII
jgi:hypothetical protein